MKAPAVAGAKPDALGEQSDYLVHAAMKAPAVAGAKSVPSSQF